MTLSDINRSNADGDGKRRTLLMPETLNIAALGELLHIAHTAQIPSMVKFVNIVVFGGFMGFY